MSYLSNSIVNKIQSHFRVGMSTSLKTIAILLPFLLIPAGATPLKSTPTSATKIKQAKPNKQVNLTKQVNPTKIKQNDELKPTTESQPILPAGLSQLEKQDEYIVVAGNDGQGICSPTGRLIIPAKFDIVRYVGDRLFSVAKYRDDGSTAWWLLDEQGQVVAKLPEWTRTDNRRFCEGLLNIGDDFSLTAFINRQGKVVPNFDQYTDVKEFSCGLAAASYQDHEGRWSGYVNHQGKIVIGPFKEATLSKFENGLAVVGSYPPEGQPRFGVVSSTGKFIIPMKYDSASPKIEGKFVVSQNGRYMVLNADGTVYFKFPPDCTTVQPPDKWGKNVWIACGFGGVTNKNGSIKTPAKWGYCDLNGKVVMPPRFSSCAPFIGNRALAFMSNEAGEQACGIIDRSGKWIVEPKYQWISLTDETRWTLGPLQRAKESFADAGSNRAVVFDKLLRDHNFIGMPLTELEKLLGKLEKSSYRQQPTKIGVTSVGISLTPNSHCGTGSSALQFALDANDKVTGWRIYGGWGMDSQPWITENVVLEYENKGLQLANLIPKD